MLAHLLLLGAFRRIVILTYFTLISLLQFCINLRQSRKLHVPKRSSSSRIVRLHYC